MKKLFVRDSLVLLIGLLTISLLGCGQQKGSGELDLLVVTGGHAYDTTEFIEMFQSMEGIRAEFALKPDAWKLLDDGKTFHAIVFYDMWMEPITTAEKETFLKEFEN